MITKEKSLYNYFLNHLKVLNDEYKLVNDLVIPYTANVLSKGKFVYLGDFYKNSNEAVFLKELADNTLMKIYFFERYKRFFKLNDLIKLGRFYYALAFSKMKKEVLNYMSEQFPEVSNLIIKLKNRIKKERELYKLL